MDMATTRDWQTHRVDDWLLAILRFSLTLQAKDKAAVQAMADELDRLGFVARRPEFSFFLRTSTELCNAIADLSYPERNAVLRRHLARIEDPRLRVAFSAATELERSNAPRPTMPLRRSNAPQRLMRYARSLP